MLVRARLARTTAGFAPSLTALFLGAACSPTEATIRDEPPRGAASPERVRTLPPESAPAVSAAPAASAAPRPTVREEKSVTVSGVVERWRLEWSMPPEPSCQQEPDARGYACSPFVYGESGDLHLVRARPGQPEESLALAPYVTELRRWPRLDRDGKGAAPDLAEVHRRPEVEAMKLGDYDHDGRATELVLATSAGNPFGAYRTVVVGISRTDERLHFFGTTKLPGEPLVLGYKGQWEQVLAHVPVELPQVRCGDHGSPREVTYLVEATKAGLGVTQRSYGCRGPQRERDFLVEEVEPCHGDGCF